LSLVKKRFLKWLKENISKTENGNESIIPYDKRKVEQQRLLLLEVNKKIHSLAYFSDKLY